MLAITIKQFAEENKGHYELIKKAIRIYQSQINYLNGKICGICDEELSVEDYNGIERDDFIFTCKTHRQYSKVFQPDIVRQKLNIPERIDNLKLI